MKGSRANYGKRGECTRLMLRLYAPERDAIACYVREYGGSSADAVIDLIRFALHVAKQNDMRTLTSGSKANE